VLAVTGFLDPTHLTNQEEHAAVAQRISGRNRGLRPSNRRPGLSASAVERSVERVGIHSAPASSRRS